jgi:hypothetical protein
MGQLGHQCGCNFAYLGGLSSLSNQPEASDFSGSTLKNLVNVTAFGASQRPVLEAVACLGNSMNLCARLTHGTAKTPLAPRR